MKDDRIYCDHILSCIDALQSYIDGQDMVVLDDRKTQKAVLRELQELAESTIRLTPERKASAPSIPWRSIAGFRNVIVHEYFDIDLPFVWEIVTQRIPELKTAILTMKRQMAP